MSQPTEPHLRRTGHDLWQGLRRDAVWQLTERATRVGLGFLLSILIARTLGPGDFGLYSYALTIVALFAFLGQAGLDALLLRELVRDPERAPRTLSEGLALRLGGALLAALGAITTALLATTGALAGSVALVAILSLSGVIQAGWVIESSLQAHKRFGHAALAKIAAYAIAAAVRLYALTLPQPLPVLATATVLESMLCTVLLWRASRRELGLGASALRLPEPQHVLELGRLVAPMLLSAMTMAIYSRIDVFMLGRMLGSEAAGIYTAGTLLSEGFYLVPTALMAAVAPRLAALFTQDPGAFADGMYRFVRLLSAAGLAIAIATTLLAPLVVDLLFGVGYEGSAGVLRIHIWSTWAVFISTASDPWYINHDLRRQYLAKTSIATVLNVLLNLLLIPRWQAEGAAWATLIAYSTSAVAAGAFWSRTRPLFQMQVRAVLGLPHRTSTRSPA